MALPMFGVMMALGMLSGSVLAMVLFRRAGLGVDAGLDACLVAAAGGIVGARALGLMLEWRAVLQDPAKAIWEAGGLTFYGGAVLGVASLAVLARMRRMAVGRMLDLMAPSLALGQAFGRLGCWFQGCCFGAPWHYGVRWPEIWDARGEVAGSPAWIEHRQNGWIMAGQLESLPTVPVQLVEAGLCGVLAVVLLAMARRRTAGGGRWYEGEVAAYWGLAYGAMRALLETMRGDALRGGFAGFSTSQWIAFGAMAFSLWYLMRKPLEHAPPAGEV